MRIEYALQLSNAAFGLTPFGATLPAYQQLWQNNSTYVRWFNYQAYADNPSVDGYLSTYAQLTQTIPNEGPSSYGTLGLGIASSTSAPRGLQPPEIFTVWDNLQSQGMTTAFICCLEDSAENNYFRSTTAFSAQYGLVKVTWCSKEHIGTARRVEVQYAVFLIMAWLPPR